MKHIKKNSILIIGAAILDILVSPAAPEVFSYGSYPAAEILCFASLFVFPEIGANEMAEIFKVAKSLCVLI